MGKPNRLDTVRELFGVNRTPNGIDEKAILRAEEHLAVSQTATIELASHAGYEAVNRGTLMEERRKNIAGIFEPEFRTKIWQIPYNETVPTTDRPTLGLGWVLGSITLYPPIKTDFTVPAGLLLHLQGMDEVSDLYLPFSAVAQNIKMRHRNYGTIAIQMNVIGTNPGTLLQPPMVAFQWEKWGNGRPMGEDNP